MKRPLIGMTVNYVPPSEERCPSQFGSFYLNRSYVDAVWRGGGQALAIPFTDDPAAADSVLDALDGLCLTGGKDMDAALWGESLHPACERVIPAKSAFEVRLVQSALKRDLPLLGLCLGLQTLNVACGGSLIQDLPSQLPDLDHPRQDEAHRLMVAHTVAVLPGSLLARATGRQTLEVNSVHHQAVARVGQGLTVTATSPDGIVEGLESAAHSFVLTVQWHPEDLIERPEQLALFSALTEAAAARKGGPN